MHLLAPRSRSRSPCTHAECLYVWKELGRKATIIEEQLNHTQSARDNSVSVNSIFANTSSRPNTMSDRAMSDCTIEIEARVSTRETTY